MTRLAINALHIPPFFFSETFSLSSSLSSANCHSLASSSIYHSSALYASIPALLPESAHALLRDCHVPLGRGSFGRLTHFRSMTVTTLPLYCSDLSGQHSCYCSCQCQVLFDTGYRKWLNKRRASLSRLSPDNSFEVIRRRQHQIFSTTSIYCPSCPFLVPLESYDAAVLSCQALRYGCGTST